MLYELQPNQKLASEVQAGDTILYQDDFDAYNVLEATFKRQYIVGNMATETVEMALRRDKDGRPVFTEYYPKDIVTVFDRNRFALFTTVSGGSMLEIRRWLENNLKDQMRVGITDQGYVQAPLDGFMCITHLTKSQTITVYPGWYVQLTPTRLDIRPPGAHAKVVSLPRDPNEDWLDLP